MLFGLIFHTDLLLQASRSCAEKTWVQRPKGTSAQRLRQRSPPEIRTSGLCHLLKKVDGNFPSFARLLTEEDG